MPPTPARPAPHRVAPHAATGSRPRAPRWACSSCWSCACGRPTRPAPSVRRPPRRRWFRSRRTAAGRSRCRRRRCSSSRSWLPGCGRARRARARAAARRRCAARSRRCRPPPRLARWACTSEPSGADQLERSRQALVRRNGLACQRQENVEHGRPGHRQVRVERTARLWGRPREVDAGPPAAQRDGHDDGQALGAEAVVVEDVARAVRSGRQARAASRA